MASSYPGNSDQLNTALAREQDEYHPRSNRKWFPCNCLGSNCIFSVPNNQTETLGSETIVAKRGIMVCICDVRFDALEYYDCPILEVLAGF